MVKIMAASREAAIFVPEARHLSIICPFVHFSVLIARLSLIVIL